MDLIFLMTDAHKNLKLYFLLNTKVSGLPRVLWFDDIPSLFHMESLGANPYPRGKEKLWDD